MSQQSGIRSVRVPQQVSLYAKGDCQNWHLEVTLLYHAVRLVQHQETHPTQVCQMRLPQPHQLPQPARRRHNDLQHL